MSHSLNFLDAVSPGQAAKPVRSRQPRRPWRRVVIGIALVVLLATAVFGIAGALAFTAALEGRDALELAKTKAEQLDFEGAREDVAHARDALNRANASASVLAPLSIVPVIGAHVEAARVAAHTGASLAASLEDILDIGAEIVRLAGVSSEDIQSLSAGLDPGVRFGDLPSETKRAIFARLASSASDLDVLSVRLRLALQEVASLREDELAAPIVAALRPFEDALIKAEEAVALAADGARILPSFAGLNGRTESLLLFLNNNELRPGGGFIGSFGELATQNGDIADLETFDVYTLDDAAQAAVTLTPPGALSKYNATSKWLFRDSNWWPDFAESAKFSVERYREEYVTVHGHDRPVSSVIAMTPTFVGSLLGITGPIEVRGQTFRQENIADLLEYQVGFGFAADGTPYAQRKEILSELVNALKDRLYDLPFSQWTQVADVVRASLEQKQLMMWSADERIQQAIEVAGWGARVPDSTTQDVQLIADANLASLKTDPFVKRDISYQVFQNSSKQWIGRTTIRYTHTGTFTYKTSRYRTYTRLYVPKGSRFIRAEGTLANDKLLNPSLAAGTVDVGSELGYTVFGAFTSIEPGTSRELTFEYELAPTVVDMINSGTYRLFYVKQPGAQARGLTLKLDFDKNLTGAIPAEDPGAWGDDVYQISTEVNKDQVFTVTY